MLTIIRILIVLRFQKYDICDWKSHFTADWKLNGAFRALIYGSIVHYGVQIRDKIYVDIIISSAQHDITRKLRSIGLLWGSADGAPVDFQFTVGTILRLWMLYFRIRWDFRIRTILNKVFYCQFLLTRLSNSGICSRWSHNQIGQTQRRKHHSVEERQ